MLGKASATELHPQPSWVFETQCSLMLALNSFHSPSRSLCFSFLKSLIISLHHRTQHSVSLLPDWDGGFCGIRTLSQNGVNPFLVKEVLLSVSCRELVTSTLIYYYIWFCLTPDTFIYWCCIFKTYFLGDLVSTWHLYPPLIKIKGLLTLSMEISWQTVKGFLPTF